MSEEELYKFPSWLKWAVIAGLALIFVQHSYLAYINIKAGEWMRVLMYLSGISFGLLISSMLIIFLVEKNNE